MYCVPNPRLEVLDQAFCDQAKPLLAAADECFQNGPLVFAFLFAFLFFLFGDSLELGIDFGQFGFVQAQLGWRCGNRRGSMLLQLNLKEIGDRRRQQREPPP